MMQKENKLILYKDDEGRVSVNVRFADEDVWLAQAQLATIYATTPQNISLHIGNVYQDGELNEAATRKKFFLVRQEGKRQVQREIDHYNLDVIIDVKRKGLSLDAASLFWYIGRTGDVMKLRKTGFEGSLPL